MKYKIKQIILETYDNPGWGIEVYYDRVISSERIMLLSRHISTTDWIIQFIEGNHLDVAGDQDKLPKLIELIVDYIKPEEKYRQMVSSLSPILEWLSKWYANECDEYWEHLYGISGSMASTGRCQLQIDLDETIWEDIAFQSIASPHLTCEKLGTKFKIDCAADQLKEGLMIFKDWIEANDCGYY